MKKVWRVCKIAGNVLLYVVLAIALFVVVLSIATKKDADGAATVFGKQIRIVRSDSMEKCEETDVSGFDIKDLPIKTLLVIDVVPTDAEEAKVRKTLASRNARSLMAIVVLTAIAITTWQVGKR